MLIHLRWRCSKAWSAVLDTGGIPQTVLLKCPSTLKLMVIAEATSPKMRFSSRSWKELSSCDTRWRRKHITSKSCGLRLAKEADQCMCRGAFSGKLLLLGDVFLVVATGTRSSRCGGTPGTRRRSLPASALSFLLLFSWLCHPLQRSPSWCTFSPGPSLEMELMEGKKIFCKKLLTFFLFSFIFSSCLFVSLRKFRTSEPEHYDSSPSAQVAHAGNASTPPKGEHRLTILLWKWPFGRHFHFTNCSELYSTPDCHFTVNHSWSQKADAVIMHHRDVCRDREGLAQLPRLPSQRWIWFNLESPSHSPNLGAMDNLFNLTMSYRRDSDIFIPYGELRLLGQPQPLSIPPKTKLVAWVISNWRAGSHRVKYYQELKKHITVDVYGRHHLPLPWDKLLPTVSQYNFYLAFENSQHEDYITEKLWRNALSSGTVPVVLGPPRENYERFLPPDSFIHVDDFASAGDLARYLWELSEDAERYQRYFQWRKWLKPVVEADWARHVCRACHFLQMTEARYQVVPDLSEWFV